MFDLIQNVILLHLVIFIEVQDTNCTNLSVQLSEYVLINAIV